MKTLKIGVLTLAILGIFGVILNTNAQTNSEVSITIDAGTNSCTLDPYSFSNTGVSATDVDLGTLTNTLNCELYGSVAAIITIEQEDLLGAGPNVIDADQVTVSSTTFSNVGSLSWTTAFAAENTWDAPAANLYEIGANEAGTTSADVTVGVVVPGGTPADSYAGNLVITIIA